MDLAEEDFFFFLKPKDEIWEGDVTGLERTINKCVLRASQGSKANVGEAQNSQELKQVCSS